MLYESIALPLSYVGLTNSEYNNRGARRLRRWERAAPERRRARGRGWPRRERLRQCSGGRRGAASGSPDRTLGTWPQRRDHRKHTPHPCPQVYASLGAPTGWRVVTKKSRRREIAQREAGGILSVWPICSFDGSVMLLYA